MPRLPIALTAAMLLLGASPALALAPGESTVCKTLRADTGQIRLPGRGGHLSVLVTGDSMSYPIDQEMAVEEPAGMVVHSDRHDGTGLTTQVVNWPRLAVRQVERFHPDATVITIGGRDGGIQLPDPDTPNKLTECCGARWLRLYANLLRPLARAYVRGGLGHVYWLTLPAPAEAARAPLYEAVNAALGLLAAEFRNEITLIPVSAVVSPGGFQSQITYEGLTISPRTPDGIHLNHAGACVERSLVVQAMLAEGQLEPARGAFGVPVGWGPGIR
jgi:lysophospholipase L1-like esterase